MPNVDERRWPPEAKIITSPIGQGVSEVRFTEIHAFLEQILVIVAEGTNFYGLC